MSLEDNLADARNALGAVRNMHIVSTNQREGRIRAAGGMEAAIQSGQRVGARHRGRLDYVLRAMRHGLDHQLSLHETLFSANQTRFLRVGNCQEQCELVVEYLYARGAGPIDLMAFTAWGYDHTFVIIGLTGTSTMLRENPGTGLYRPNLRDWGPETVWCDPWQGGGVVFAVPDLIRGSVRNLDSRYKCHTAESVEEGAPKSILRLERNRL